MGYKNNTGNPTVLGLTTNEAYTYFLFVLAKSITTLIFHTAKSWKRYPN